MSVGDIASVHSSVANGSYLSIQPSGTTQWGIQNIYIPRGVICEIYRTDGTNDMLMWNTSDSMQFVQPIFATNTIYFRIKNVSGSASYLGYDAMISKV
jgi:hypothetical protein